MQPLISPVDHESRTNHRAEDETRTSEATPLLQRFPRYQNNDNRYGTRAIVSLLLLILLAGIVIGTYLLIIQSRSEHVLPPIEGRLRYVNRLQWDMSKKVNQQLDLVLQSKKNTVIIVQTDTEQCGDTETCAMLFNSMQKNGNRLDYNFLVSSDGQTFEALGWERNSMMFPEYSANAVVLAFIGNFTSQAPSHAQVLQAQTFLENSINEKYLDVNFEIIGKKTKQFPKYLFSELSTIPQWNEQLSDMN